MGLSILGGGMVQLIRRVRPFSLALLALLLSGPWQLKLYKAFDLAPSSWLVYGAAVTVAVYWLGAGYYWDFAKAHNRATDRAALISIIGAVVVTLGGFLVIWFSDTIYTHARFALQRAQMERVANRSSDACPALRCIRTSEGEAAFVWGAMPGLWSGACFDPHGAIAAAEEAELQDRFAGRPRQARVFGGVVTQSKPLAPRWVRCSVSTTRLGEARNPT